MIGPYFIAGGVLTLLAAFAVMHNTSLGGTRSDYDDGSGCLAYVGVALLIFGVIGTVVEVLQ